MKQRYLIGLFAGLFALLSPLACAADEAISISKAWAAASPAAAPTGAAYMTITNQGDADRLLSAAAEVSKKVELHATKMENNVMKMARQDAVEIPAGGEVAFAPGGLHVMFIGLHQPLKEGDSFPLTLRFENAGEMTLDIKIMSREQGMSHSGHSH